MDLSKKVVYTENIPGEMFWFQQGDYKVVFAGLF